MSQHDTIGPIAAMFSKCVPIVQHLSKAHYKIILQRRSQQLVQ